MRKSSGTARRDAMAASPPRLHSALPHFCMRIETWLAPCGGQVTGCLTAAAAHCPADFPQGIGSENMLKEPLHAVRSR